MGVLCEKLSFVKNVHLYGYAVLCIIAVSLFLTYLTVETGSGVTATGLIPGS